MRWNHKKYPNQEIVRNLEKSLNIPNPIAVLLAQRGVTNFEEAKTFFRPSLDNLHDPFLMKDMDKAVERIEKAIDTNERILVFGDYDVDGTSAVALVSSFLKTISPLIDYYIPDRYLEGYGISTKGIDYAHDNEISLIIALDCGIKSVDKIAYANSKGIDFIICDHHRPGDLLPDAVAVLDPKRSDCFYPYDELCGCGVGFKLIQAISQKRNLPEENLIPYLDLVATAIGADIVPITGENRILAYFGLQVLNANPRPGFKALIQKINKKILTITDVVFVIAPRINAAGRIKHGNYAVQLLTEFSEEQAIEFAQEIELFNSSRKEFDQNITIEALSQIKENNEENRLTTVVYNENWHKGVIGIVASRLTETYYRPTLVFTKSGDFLAASARSIKDFDVYEALEQCAEFIEQFGGHKYAAGLTLRPENYEKFKQQFENVVEKTIDRNLLIQEISIDMPLNFCEIEPKFIRILKQFEPFGPENMHPVFYTKNVSDTGYCKNMGNNNEHLKLFLKQGEKEQRFAAIGFKLGQKIAISKNQAPLEIAYTIDENEWNGEVSVQLSLKDLKPLEG
uniref:single-stranded-DNA-specific exonuclease RecJ n=1 Tax=Flavobacterium sp. TaxID=239 RepID=UPI004048F04C